MQKFVIGRWTDIADRCFANVHGNIKKGAALRVRTTVSNSRNLYQRYTISPTRLLTNAALYNSTHCKRMSSGAAYSVSCNYVYMFEGLSSPREGWLWCGRACI